MIDRAHKRMKVVWPAELRRECRIPIRCHVLDIATGGARIRAELFFPVGSIVDLVIDRIGVFPGKVLWQRGNHAGIGFLEEAEVVQRRLAEAPRVSQVTTA